MKKLMILVTMVVFMSVILSGTILEWTPEGSHFMEGPDANGFEVWLIADSPSWHPDGSYKVKEIFKNGSSYGIVKYPCAWPLSFPTEKTEKPTVDEMLKWIIKKMCITYGFKAPWL